MVCNLSATLTPSGSLRGVGAAPYMPTSGDAARLYGRTVLQRVAGSTSPSCTIDGGTVDGPRLAAVHVAASVKADIAAPVWMPLNCSCCPHLREWPAGCFPRRQQVAPRRLVTGRA